MTGKETRIAAVGALALAALTLAAGVAAAGREAGGPADAGAGSLRCEIRQSVGGGRILLEPTVTAAGGASGSYSLTLEGGGSGGSSSIRQGGDFTAAPGSATSLGQVSLGARGAAYRARLEVTAGGRSAVCTGTISGAI